MTLAHCLPLPKWQVLEDPARACEKASLSAKCLRPVFKYGINLKMLSSNQASSQLHKRIHQWRHFTLALGQQQ